MQGDINGNDGQISPMGFTRYYVIAESYYKSMTETNVKYNLGINTLPVDMMGQGSGTQHMVHGCLAQHPNRSEDVMEWMDFVSPRMLQQWFHYMGILLMALSSGRHVVIANIGFGLSYCHSQSINDDILDNFEARRALEAEDAFLAARTAAWNLLHQQTGFPRPEDEPRIVLYRWRDLPPLRLLLHPDAHTDDILRRIESHWPDLNANSGNVRNWRVHLAHPNIASSRKIDPSYAHFILIDGVDALQEQDRHTVIFEIDNTYVDNEVPEVYAFRFNEPLTRASIILEAGYLPACSQTLRCRTWINDVPVDQTGVRTNTADFVLLSTALMRIEPPGLSVQPRPTSVGERIPGEPTARPSSAYAMPVDVQNEQEDTGFEEQLCVIWRPDFGYQWPIAARTAGELSEEIITNAALRTWPELGTGHLSTMAVHRAYQDVINLDPQAIYVMAVWREDFRLHPHLRAVLVMLRIDGVRDLRAVPLAHQTSGMGLAAWARILHRCYRARTHTCSMWRNGHQIYGAYQVLLEHADFLHIEAYPAGSNFAESHMLPVYDDQIPELSSGDSLWPGAPLHRSGTVVTSSHTVQVPRQSRSRSRTTGLHEEFWIYNAVAAWIGAFCIMLTLPAEHRPGKRRRRRKVRKTRTCTTLLLIGLIMMQHYIPCVQALQRQWDTTETMYGRHQHGTLWARPPLQGLPPPGNPHPETTKWLSTTSCGQDLQEWICNFLSYKHHHGQIWTALRSIRHVPTPVRAGRNSCARQISLQDALFGPEKDLQLQQCLKKSLMDH